MIKFRLFVTAFCLSLIGNAQLAFQAETVFNTPPTFQIIEPDFGVDDINEGTLYSNGPFYNVTGSPNRSLLQDATFGMATYGYGHALSSGYRVADDWVVTENVQVDNIQFYAYQTGSTTTSTINFMSLAIWDGNPSDPSSSIIWGDQSTNRLSSTTYASAYRSLESSPTDNSRPIMISTVNTPGLTLAPGTYWLDWNAGGTLSSGPWAPPITITGVSTTGNAIQFDGATWTAMIDIGAQGLPFEVNGTVLTLDGCLDAPNGQYPGTSFTPECNFLPESITDLAWTGEYSVVNVTAGTEYTFSSSVSTDFVTISDEAGNTVYAAGTSPVTWTAPSNQSVRFYLHFDSDCTWAASGLRSRLVSCAGVPPTEYCEPFLDCTDGDLITNVTFQEINNNSSCSPNGYGNYTDMQATVEAGGTYPMSVTVGSGWTYESVMVWVDYNNNFMFEASEYTFIGSDPGTTNTGNITIPAGTPDGNYRMRVRVGAVNPDLNDLSAMACDESTVYGETEDYTLVVGNGGGGDCAWTITVSGNSFGDEVSWQFRSGSTVLLSGGPYSDVPFFDSQTVTAAGPLEFYIETMGTFNDNSASFQIENPNGVIISGSINGGNEATYSNLNCSDTPPPPPTNCEDFEVLSNGLENGLFFGGDTAQRIATDVPLADAGFTVYGMEPTVIGAATTFTFTFYEDAGGIPGTEIATRTGEIFGEVNTGSNFGYDFIKYTVGFNEPIDFAANTTYWIEIESDAVAWETTSASSLGNGDVFWNTNVSGWTATGGDEYVFNLVCSPLGLSDATEFDFAYYPNPVKDVLNISTKKGIESVSAFNLAGQQVMSNAKATNGQVNLSTLPAGTYVFKVVLEGGQVETFKIIKK